MKLQIVGWPHPILTVGISLLIYMNFFTHHYLPDLRWVLMLLLLIVFIRTFVSFEVLGKKYRMPMVLSFFLIGFFIWIAENISTFLGAWRYPDQDQAWRIVHIGKISSWFLLVVISVIIVGQLKRVKSTDQEISDKDNS
ncbi:membrane protein [Paenibacillus pini JCM 16418]|uniref:Membrane protein n=1 Tax=Paenibacillus pini JCM 16418 TaxID=1236976 RepID=W7YUW6_9BACL|nr:membrane protein [Paenibacillus pini JCM 16418]